jgi:hypothetical protein
LADADTIAEVIGEAVTYALTLQAAAMAANLKVSDDVAILAAINLMAQATDI